MAHTRGRNCQNRQRVSGSQIQREFAKSTFIVKYFTNPEQRVNTVKIGYGDQLIHMCSACSANSRIKNQRPGRDGAVNSKPGSEQRVGEFCQELNLAGAFLSAAVRCFQKSSPKGTLNMTMRTCFWREPFYVTSCCEDLYRISSAICCLQLGRDVFRNLIQSVDTCGAGCALPGSSDEPERRVKINSPPRLSGCSSGVAVPWTTLCRLPYSQLGRRPARAFSTPWWKDQGLVRDVIFVDSQTSREAPRMETSQPYQLSCADPGPFGRPQIMEYKNPPTSAPAIPITVVISNPILCRPGTIIRAINPTTRPHTTHPIRFPIPMILPLCFRRIANSVRFSIPFIHATYVPKLTNPLSVPNHCIGSA
jgi:hypothetical protein